VQILLVPVLLAGPLWTRVPQVRRSLAALAGRDEVRQSGLSLRQSLHHFTAQVRAATPETSGFLDPEVKPEYGIICPSLMGFIVNYHARRATPSGNFGPYVGREGFALSRGFYRARSEGRALTLARALEARYVITSAEAGAAPSMLLYRLHRLDGAAAEGEGGGKGEGKGASEQGVPALEHFRLVTEGPPRGFPLGALGGAVPGNVVAPYKLFEIVEGAVLEIRAAPGSEVEVSLEVATPARRRFRYRAVARAGEAGVARIRVPYATETAAPARPTGPYRVRAESAGAEVHVSEEQVLRGAVLAIALAPGGSSPSAESRRPLAEPRISGTLPIP
jgi:hypothetical protein